MQMTSLLRRDRLHVLFLVSALFCCSSLRPPVSLKKRRDISQPRIVKNMLRNSYYEDISVSLYDLQLSFASVLQSQLSNFTFGGLALVYVAGLISAFTPCEVGLLPLTLVYLDSSSSERLSRAHLMRKAAYYAFGFSCTLTFFGVSSSYFGHIYGDVVGVDKVSSTLVAILVLISGLNLLGFAGQFKNMSFISRLSEFPEPFDSVVFGAASALIASPCTSPLLTSLLVYISTSRISPIFGAALIMSFSLGFTSPVVAAGLYSKSTTFYRNFSWSNNILAFLLISFGVYSMLSLI